jgi:hypothetical protein
MHFTLQQNRKNKEDLKLIDSRQETLDELIEEFLNRPQKCCDEDDHYSKLESLEEAVRQASLALTANGTISGHQRQWVSRESMQLAQVRLLSVIDKIQACTDFDALYEFIERSLMGIEGLGDLYYYDTSRRIGAFLGLYPKRVYLHRGTKDGARALGLDHKQRYINMISLPPALRKLEPKQVEDFLCVCKEQLKNIR